MSARPPVYSRNENVVGSPFNSGGLLVENAVGSALQIRKQKGRQSPVGAIPTVSREKNADKSRSAHKSAAPAFRGKAKEVPFRGWVSPASAAFKQANFL